MYLAVEFLVEHAAHFRLLRNRRRHIKRAYLRQDLTLDKRPNSTMGLAFVQDLYDGRGKVCGHTHALRGVVGSR